MMKTLTTQFLKQSDNEEKGKEKSAKGDPDQDSKSSILAKISDKNKSSIEDCIERYGDAVWMISQKFTDSPEKAEKLTCKIFSDLWENIENFDCSKTSDEHFILLIAMKCARKYGKNLH